MIKNKIKYGTWHENGEDLDEYLELHDTISDAVYNGQKDDDGNVEVFSYTPKRLGLYKSEKVIKKVKEVPNGKSKKENKKSK